MAARLPAVRRLPDRAPGPPLRLPSLLVVGALEREVVPIGGVEQQRHEGVPAAVLVHIGRPVPDPLPGHEDRHADVELELHHLAGRGVPVAPQVADQAAGLAHLAGAVAVADPGGALDVLVAAHVVDQRHEAVVEDGEVPAEDLLGGLVRWVAWSRPSARLLLAREREQRLPGQRKGQRLSQESVVELGQAERPPSFAFLVS
jgi:hypothetical protein